MWTNIQQSWSKHTSLTCMTLLNSSCPLNIAVISLRKLYQRHIETMKFYWINISHTHIQINPHFGKGYRQLGLLQGACRMLLCPCLCFSRPCPPECQPSPPCRPCWKPPSASSSPLCSQAIGTRNNSRNCYFSIDFKTHNNNVNNTD